MTLIDRLKQARLAKLEQIGLLASGEMRTLLHGIDVSGATLSQEREEVELIEGLLREFGVAIAED